MPKDTRVLIARLARDGEETASAALHVRAYKDTDGDVVISNVLDKPYAIDGVKELTVANAKTETLSEKEAKDLVLAATCANDKECGVQLLTTAESAWNLVEADAVCCTVCGDPVEVDVTTLTEAAGKAVDEALAAAAEEAGRAGEPMGKLIAAHKAGDDAKVKKCIAKIVKALRAGGFPKATVAMEGNEVNVNFKRAVEFEKDYDVLMNVLGMESADTQGSKQEHINLATAEVEDDELDEEVDIQELKEEIDDENDETDVEDDEGEEAPKAKKKKKSKAKRKAKQAKKVVEEEAAEELSTIEVNLSEHHEFDERTLTVAALSPETFAVSVMVDDALTPIGTLHRGSAVATAQELMTAGSVQTLANTIIASLKAGSSLEDFGWRDMKVKVDLSREQAQRIEAASMLDDETLADHDEQTFADYDQSVSIALSGMAKGVFPNVLIKSLSMALAQNGVQGAERVVARALDGEVIEEFAANLVAQAREIAAYSLDERNAVAKTIDKKEMPTTESAAQDVVLPTQVNFATAHITPSIAPETASAGVSFDRAELFPRG